MSDENVNKVVTYRTGEGLRLFDSGAGKRTVTVVAFVPAGASLRRAERVAGSKVPRLCDAMDDCETDRYLVREDRTGAKGQPISPRWFAPRASVIDKAILAAEDAVWVDFGRVAHDRLKMQCQYASHYIDGRNGSPNFGEGLRWREHSTRGPVDARDYHDIDIHRDDVETFVERVNQYRRETRQIA